MDKCKSCYYNFDGVCANHCYFEVFAPMSSGDFYVLDDIDPYGVKCSELKRKSPYHCSGYRPSLNFLCEQKCSQ